MKKLYLSIPKKGLALLSFVLPFFLQIHATPQLPHEMYELLEVCGVQHEGTLSSITQATQSLWLRKKGLERWQLDEKDFGHKKNQAILR